MKKGIILLCMVLLFVACGNEKTGETREVRITFLNSEDVYSELVDVEYDDGLVFMKEKDLISLLVNVEWIDFGKLSSESYLVDTEVLKAKIEGNAVKVEVKDDFIEKSFDDERGRSNYIEQQKIWNSYLKYRKDSFELIEDTSKLTYKTDGYFELNEIFPVFGFNFVLKGNTTKEYVVTREIYSNVAKQNTEKLNEKAYNIIGKELRRKEENGRINKEVLDYYKENKEGFIESFKYNANKLIELSEDRHFSFFDANIFDEKEYLNERFFEVEDLSGINYIAYEHFRYEQLDSLNKLFSGMDRDKDLILDLRGNSGGVGMNMLYLLSIISEKDLNLYLKVNGQNRNIVLDDMSELSYNGNLVVLIDERSYSAASIFASMVQDNDLGIVIGDKSGGGTVPQFGLLLPNGYYMNTDSNREYVTKEYESIDKGREADIMLSKDLNPINESLAYLKEL